MKILELELIGFERFALKAIKYFKITPEAKCQMLLGTNGSGKTSLIEEMSPMPASKDRYDKDGSKSIVIEHHGDIYKLRSVFSPSQKHSFVINDGENLNKGGTLTAQKELVRQHFGLTQDLHDMLTGIRCFTDMSPSERREWFTKMSSVDYEYAISYYQRLKEKARDLTGVIKHTSSRLATEISKLTTTQDFVDICSYLEVLKNTEKKLLEERAGKLDSSKNLKTKILAIDDETERLSRQILGIENKFQQLIPIYGNRTTANEKLVAAEVAIRHTSNRMRELSSLMEDKKKSVDALKSANIDNVTSIDSRISELEEKKREEEQLIAVPDLFNSDPIATNNYIDLIERSVTEIITDLEVDPESLINKPALDSLKEQLMLLETNLNRDEETRRIVSLKLDRQKDLLSKDKTKCPKCEHEWVVGSEPTLIEIYEKRKKELDNKIQLTKTSIDEISIKIASFKKYLDDFNRLTYIFHESNNGSMYLSKLWLGFINTGRIRTQPKSLLNFMRRLRDDNITRQRISVIDAKLKEFSELRNKISGMTNEDITNIRKQLDEMSDAYNEYLVINQTNQSLKISLTNLMEAYEQASRFKDSIIERTNHKAVLIEQYETVLKNEAIDSVLVVLRNDLDTHETLKTKAIEQQKLVDMLTKDLEENKADLITVNKMLKSLSPTDGLIAKGLIGFMNSFMNQMNSFISKIWLYDLKVEPCLPVDSESIGLTYNFPVSINGEVVSPDVAKTSKGMKEILNLAFRLVAMKYLNMSDYILVLDEFSTNMDEAHKRSAFNAISTIMAYSEFEHLFIVSHYYQSYGSIKNADICVLCDANITIPKDVDYNKHIVMK